MNDNQIHEAYQSWAKGEITLEQFVDFLSKNNINDIWQKSFLEVIAKN